MYVEVQGHLTNEYKKILNQIHELAKVLVDIQKTDIEYQITSILLETSRTDIISPDYIQKKLNVIQMVLE